MSGQLARATKAATIAALATTTLLTTLLTTVVPASASASPPTLASGSITPATIVGGDGAVQTITLSRPAPACGVHISLYGDLVYGASTGRSAFVPAGARSVTFPFRTSAPESTVVRAFHAQVDGSPLTKIAEVTILPTDPRTRAVRELRLATDAAVLGGVVEGTVELAGPAPAGGIAVSLWSNTHYGPGVYVPPYVTVSAGRTSATFPAAVTSAEEPAVVRPSADLGTSRATADLLVVPQRFSVSGGLAGRDAPTTFAVGIGSAPNPAGTTVALRSDTPGVTVPATVTIPPGSPGATFPVTVADDVPRSTLGHLTATWNGATVSSYVITDQVRTWPGRSPARPGQLDLARDPSGPAASGARTQWVPR